MRVKLNDVCTILIGIGLILIVMVSSCKIAVYRLEKHKPKNIPNIETLFEEMERYNETDSQVNLSKHKKARQELIKQLTPVCKETFDKFVNERPDIFIHVSFSLQFIKYEIKSVRYEKRKKKYQTNDGEKQTVCTRQEIKMIVSSREKTKLLITIRKTPMQGFHIHSIKIVNTDKTIYNKFNEENNPDIPNKKLKKMKSESQPIKMSVQLYDDELQRYLAIKQIKDCIAQNERAFTLFDVL